MIAVVVDGTYTVGGHAQSGSTAANSATAPAVTLSNNTGSSVLLEFYGHRTATAWSAAPSGYTRLTSTARVCANTKNLTTTDGSIAQPNTATSSGYRGATVELVPPPAKIETLTGDPANWTLGGTSTLSGGQFSLPCTSAYNEVNSKLAYDLTGSSFVVRFPQSANVGTGTTETSVRLFVDASNYASFFFNNGNISYYDASNGDDYHTYSPTDHAWLRFRCSGTTLYWDSSPDGITWTQRRSVSTVLNFTKLFVKFKCGYYGTESNPGTALWDTVNLPPVSAINSGAFFQFF